MSFGGSVASMITSLKNNKRSRVSTFKKLKRYESIPYKEGVFDKKATPEQLKAIREKLQKENRRSYIIQIVFIVLFFILLYSLFNVVKF